MALDECWALKQWGLLHTNDDLSGTSAASASAVHPITACEAPDWIKTDTCCVEPQLACRYFCLSPFFG